MDLVFRTLLSFSPAHCTYPQARLPFLIWLILSGPPEITSSGSPRGLPSHPVPQAGLENCSSGCWHSPQIIILTRWPWNDLFVCLSFSLHCELFRDRNCASSITVSADLTQGLACESAQDNVYLTLFLHPSQRIAALAYQKLVQCKKC